MAGPYLRLGGWDLPLRGIGSHCRLALESLGSQELACGWAVDPPLLAGFQGPD